MFPPTFKKYEYIVPSKIQKVKQQKGIGVIEKLKKLLTTEPKINSFSWEVD